MSNDCRDLDAYLADELPVADGERFANHLSHCEECRETIDEQQWIDGLLRLSATDTSEIPPDDILVSLGTSIAQRRRRNRIFACGLATAAAVVVALGWTVLKRQPGDQSGESARANLAVNDQLHSEPPPRATFVARSNVIAVTVASRHPDVTVVRIYPAYQPNYETQTARIEPEAAISDPWAKYSNGG